MRPSAIAKGSWLVDVSVSVSAKASTLVDDVIAIGSSVTGLLSGLPMGRRAARRAGIEKKQVLLALRPGMASGRESADISDKVGGLLSSGGPEVDGEGLCLVTYWPNK